MYHHGYWNIKNEKIKISEVWTIQVTQTPTAKIRTLRTIAFVTDLVPSQI